MSGERTLLNTGYGRTAAALLTAAVALVLAPVAAATPESDAADAINQAYDASGGTTGPMGPERWRPLPGRRAASARTTPAARSSSPPTPVPTSWRARSCRSTSRSAGPPTVTSAFRRSTRVPAGSAGQPQHHVQRRGQARHLLDARHRRPCRPRRDERGVGQARRLGGAAGGADRGRGLQRRRRLQKFTGGELSWNRSTKEFTTVPPDLAGQLAGLTVPEDATSAINAARRAAGGSLGPLGAKQGPQYAIGQDGAGQDFAGGKIFYSPATGANVVTGQVLKKYESVGGPQSDLGFPTSNEADGGLKTGSRVSTVLRQGQAGHLLDARLRRVHRARGDERGVGTNSAAPAGSLGPPVADQTEDGNVVSQRFTGGEISWDKQTNKFSTAAGQSGLRAGRPVGARLRTARRRRVRRRRNPRGATGLRRRGGGCSPVFRCWCWSGWCWLRRCGTGAAATWIALTTTHVRRRHHP